MEDYNSDIVSMPKGYPLSNPIPKIDIDVFLICNGKKYDLYNESTNNGIIHSNRYRNQCILGSMID